MIVLSVLLFFFGSEFIFMVKDIVGNEVCNALDWLIDAAAVMLLILASVSIHVENIIAQNTDRRTMDFIRHMRRSAFFRRQAGRFDNGNYLESGDTVSDKKQTNFPTLPQAWPSRGPS